MLIKSSRPRAEIGLHTDMIQLGESLEMVMFPLFESCCVCLKAKPCDCRLARSDLWGGTTATLLTSKYTVTASCLQRTSALSCSGSAPKIPTVRFCRNWCCRNNNFWAPRQPLACNRGVFSIHACHLLHDHIEVLFLRGGRSIPSGRLRRAAQSSERFACTHRSSQRQLTNARTRKLCAMIQQE
jgi:hypothetical protein